MLVLALCLVCFVMHPWSASRAYSINTLLLLLLLVASLLVLSYDAAVSFNFDNRSIQYLLNNCFLSKMVLINIVQHGHM